jgi:hypothetical protein
MKHTGTTSKRNTALNAGDNSAHGFQDFGCIYFRRVKRANEYEAL